MRIRPEAYLLIAGGTLAVAGCAVNGAAFEEPMKAPVGSSLVYFYRPPEIQGSALKVYVNDKGTELSVLKNGQFLALPLEPGHHEFGTNVTGRETVSVDTVAGETYYLRYAMVRGAIKNTPVFARVYTDDAIADLRDCCKNGAELTELMR